MDTSRYGLDACIEEHHRGENAGPAVWVAKANLEVRSTHKEVSLALLEEDLANTGIEVVYLVAHKPVHVVPERGEGSARPHATSTIRRPSS